MSPTAMDRFHREVERQEALRVEEERKRRLLTMWAVGLLSGVLVIVIGVGIFAAIVLNQMNQQSNNIERVLTNTSQQQQGIAALSRQVDRELEAHRKHAEGGIRRLKDALNVVLYSIRKFAPFAGLDPSELPRTVGGVRPQKQPQQPGGRE